LADCVGKDNQSELTPKELLLSKRIAAYCRWLLLLGVLPLYANPIIIQNTGMDSTGIQLNDMGPDPNYVILELNQHPYATFDDANAYPFELWSQNSSLSRWISPRPTYATFQTDPPGIYTYRTTFDLAGLDDLTAELIFRLSADDGVTVRLNGTDAYSLPQTGPLYQQFSDYITLNSGFIPGVNTLDFVVTNGPSLELNPTGLRVEISGSADAAGAGAASSVPEPQDFALTLPALTALLAVGLRRRRVN
jgi:hypothetical protein